MAMDTTTTTTTKETKDGDTNDDDDDGTTTTTTTTTTTPLLRRLHHWPSLTTRLLRDGGSSAWNVLDQVLSDQACDGLQREIDQADDNHNNNNSNSNNSNLLDKLLPARTKGESDTEHLLALILSNQPQQQPPQQQP
jgi:hypothetical protein